MTLLYGIPATMILTALVFAYVFRKKNKYLVSIGSVLAGIFFPVGWGLILKALGARKLHEVCKKFAEFSE